MLNCSGQADPTGGGEFNHYEDHNYPAYKQKQLYISYFSSDYLKLYLFGSFLFCSCRAIVFGMSKYSNPF